MLKHLILFVALLTSTMFAMNDEDNEARESLWSVLQQDSVNNQPAQINSLLYYGIVLGDRIAQYFPRQLSQWIWHQAFDATSNCPEQNMLSGDFFSLIEKGMLKFLLDKNLEHDRAQEWIEFRLVNVPMVMPRNHDAVKKILRNDNVERGMAYDRLVYFFGSGIFTGRITERWKHQRDIAFKVLGPLSLNKEYVSLFNCIAKEISKLAKQEQQKDLVLLLSQIGLIAFCETFLGVDVRPMADELAPSINHVLSYINGALEPIMIPFGEHYKNFILHRDKVHDWMQKLAELVREAHPDYLKRNLLVQEIIKLDEEDRKDELTELMISIVLGGHETIARPVLGIMYSMMQHPSYIDLVRDEADQNFNDNFFTDRNWKQLFDQRSQFPMLQNIFDEGLRLFPPVWLAARSPTIDIEINGYRIAKGTQVMINFLLLHRDKEVFGENAEVFYPERFQNMDKNTRKKFFPFTVGPVTCPGSHFAKTEGMLLVGLLWQYLDIELVNKNQRPAPVSAGTFRLFPTLLVNIKPRTR